MAKRRRSKGLGEIDWRPRKGFFFPSKSYMTGSRVHRTGKIEWKILRGMDEYHARACMGGKYSKRCAEGIGPSPARALSYAVRSLATKIRP